MQPVEPGLTGNGGPNQPYECDADWKPKRGRVIEITDPGCDPTYHWNAHSQVVAGVFVTILVDARLCDDSC